MTKLENFKNDLLDIEIQLHSRLALFHAALFLQIAAKFLETFPTSGEINQIAVIAGKLHDELFGRIT